ncbi:MAG TPA: hypothetical protein VEL07_17535 [Planctomycetota bacterium]|nr:hypothetical protein [Planctomycetota bacterium]
MHLPIALVLLLCASAGAVADEFTIGFAAGRPLHPGERIAATAGLAQYACRYARQPAVRFAVYIPRSRAAGDALPVVFASHGTGGRPAAEAALWEAAAEQHRFIVVCPGYWSAFADPVDAGIEQRLSHDKAMLGDIARRVLGSLDVDRSMIMHSGVRNGSIPIWDIALRHPEVCTAVSLRSGTFWTGGRTPWSRAELAQAGSIAALITHGDAESGDAAAGYLKSVEFFTRTLRSESFLRTVLPGGPQTTTTAPLAAWFVEDLRPRWLKRAMRRLQAARKARRWEAALAAARTVLRIAPPDGSEREKAAQAIAEIEAAATSAIGELDERAPTADDWRAGAATWAGTVAGRLAAERAAPMAAEELQEVLDAPADALAAALQRFIDRWRGHAVADEAFAALDALARPELDQARSLPVDGGRVPALHRVADRFSPSAAADDARAEIDGIGLTMLEATLLMKDPARRAKLLEEFGAQFAGTLVGERARLALGAVTAPR